MVAFHHAQISVSDIERSRKFYAEVVGLREMMRPAFLYPGAWFELALGQQLHIVCIPDPLWHGSRKMEIYETHLALRVPSFRAAVQYLRSKGYSEDVPEDDPSKMVVRLDSPTGYPQCYIQDPDRHLIEFNAAVLD